MIVRATGYNNQSMVNSIFSQQSKLFEMYNRVENNQKFVNISENPMDSGAIISLNNQLSQISTYKNNIENARTQINVQDETFSTIVEKMQRIKDLAITAASDGSGPEGIKAAKIEIQQLKENIVNLANTQYDGKYIFAGANVTTPPYSLEADGSIKYKGTAANNPLSERKLDIADGVKVGLNATGDSVFGEYDAADPTKSTGLFKALGDLEAALNTDPIVGDDIRAQLDGIDSSIKNVSDIQAKYSTNVAKLDMTKNTHTNMDIILQSQKSNLKDVDMTTAISELVNQNYAYQASMQAYMMMNNNSLMNFM